MLSVTVVVATCGTDEWARMGNMAATYASFTNAQVVRVHLPVGTVAQARNMGLEQVKTEYVVFCDADDSLRSDYFNGVLPLADVIATMIEYPNIGVPMMPNVWNHENMPDWARHEGECVGECLADGNYIHVGAIARTAAVRAVGGFRDYPVYEDWALWLAIMLNGGTFAKSYSSIYLANARANENHRNHAMPLAARNLVHEQIVKDLTNEYNR